MKSLQELFPRGAKSFFEANPRSSPQTDSKSDVQPIVATRRGKMNKTEQSFANLLEAQKSRGEILRWEFEPITLRFAGVRYTPDFAVWRDSPTDLRFIEVKGAFISGKFSRAVERFRHARTYFDGFFYFQLWQKTKDGWGTPRI